MKLTGKEINELASKIHEINIEKGFWTKGQTDCNNTRIKLLVVSELFECFEAHRDGKSVDDYELYGVNELLVNYINFPNEFATKANFVRNFEVHVKDTIEDEIADTMIRLLDYAAFLKVDFEDLKTKKIIANRYFSGEFILDTPVGRIGKKLEAGEAVIFPIIYPHGVEKLTEGLRQNIIGWMSSNVSYEQSFMLKNMYEVNQYLMSTQKSMFTKSTLVQTYLKKAWGK